MWGREIAVNVHPEVVFSLRMISFGYITFTPKKSSYMNIFLKWLNQKYLQKTNETILFLQ